MPLHWIEEQAQDEGEVGETRRSRRYLVACSDPGDRDSVIWRSRSDLLRGAPHPTELLQWVLTSRAVRRAGFDLWDVEVEYGFLSEEERDKNPLARPAVFSSTWEGINVATLVDYRKEIMRNTAGDPYDPFEKRGALRVFNVRKNVPIDPWPEWLDDYENVVNDAPLRIGGRTYPRHTLLFVPGDMGEPEWETHGEQRFGFRQVKFSLIRNRETWYHRVVNRGLNELVKKSDGKFESNPIHVGNPEVPTTEPMLLDPKGRAFRIDGRPTNNVEPSKIVIQQFQIYPEMPFGRLPVK